MSIKGKKDDEFRSYIQSLPAMIQTSGLGKQWHIVYQGDATYSTIYSWLDEWTSKQEIYSSQKITNGIMHGDMYQYQLATAELQALWSGLNICAELTGNKHGEGYPLYQSTQHDQFLADAKNEKSNLGLQFNRFMPLYDHTRTDSKNSVKNDFFDYLRGQTGDEKQIRRFWKRQHKLISSQKGLWFTAKSDWHFVTGMGNAHRIENGFTFHHNLGLPYLPATSVKGMVRAFCELESKYEPEKMLRLFGSTHKNTKANGYESMSEALFFLMQFR